MIKKKENKENSLAAAIARYAIIEKKDQMLIPWYIVGRFRFSITDHALEMP